MRPHIFDCVIKQNDQGGVFLDTTLETGLCRTATASCDTDRSIHTSLCPKRPGIWVLSRGHKTPAVAARAGLYGGAPGTVATRGRCMELYNSG